MPITMNSDPRGRIQYAQAYDIGFDAFVRMSRDLTQFMPEKPPELKKDPRLLQDLRMDTQDVILHLFKGQPRITIDSVFHYDTWCEGRRNYERDEARLRGQFVIYHKGYKIARVTVKKHKLAQVYLGGNPKHRFVAGLFIRYLTELIPEARLEVK